MARCAAAFASTAVHEPHALERQVAELERYCRQLALETAALKKPLSTLPSRSGTR